MLNQRDLFDKQLFRLDRELRHLYRNLWVRVPLEEPIQRGWRRFHVLTAKAQNRADKDVLTAILKIVGAIQLRNSPNFRTRRGRGKRQRYIDFEQPLRTITVGHWNRLKLPEDWLTYFRQEKRCYFRSWHDVLIFQSPYLFELKIEPYWIHEVTVRDSAIEKRINEINAWLRHRNAQRRLDRLRGYRWYHWRWFEPQKSDVLNKIAQRELREARRNPSEVDPGVPTRRVRFSFRIPIQFSPA